jgi:hypothetical protein
VRTARDVLKELGFLDTSGADPILALSERLISHEIYKSITTVEQAQRYMEYQVWCVCDFMSLGKSIQTELGCYSIPWLPPTRTDLLVAINAILAEEETDVGPDKLRASHFEIFLKAMRQAGANTRPVEAFIKDLRAGMPFEKAIAKPAVPAAARDFFMTTMSIANGPLQGRVACFCVTREELVPRMFDAFIHNLSKHRDPRLTWFLWYLKRHVQLDTSKHGPRSRFLLNEVLGQDSRRLNAARKVVERALKARLKYLDATLRFVTAEA